MDFLRRIPLAVLLLGAAMVLVSAAAVGTMSWSTVSKTMSMGGEAMQEDSTTEMVSLGISKLGSNGSAVGITCGTAVEATTGLADINNTMVKNNFSYQAEIKEAAANSWAVGSYYRVQFYADGASLGTFYVKNAVNNSSTNIEGIQLTVDLGVGGTNPSLPDNYNVVATYLGTSCT